jgi:DMSO/TMAO reductase YedYZ heme-binding membrane subunit
MMFLYTLAGVILFVAVFRGAIKRAPAVFYALSFALVALLLARGLVVMPKPADNVLLALMGRCMLAQAFFFVVMLIGAFREKSRIRAYLAPIRAELSITACILALAHVVEYLSTLGLRIIANLSGWSANILAAFALSLLLTAMMALLGLTSFKALRKRIGSRTWKRIQWLAYPFFLLTWAHILLYLLPSALQGGQAAQQSVAVYSAAFLIYVIARATTALRTRSR